MGIMWERPASLVSKTHVKLTASVGQRHKKERKIKIVHADVDPDKDKAEKEKVIYPRFTPHLGNISGGRKICDKFTLKKKLPSKNL